MFDSANTQLAELQMALRLVLAALLGGVIGLEREIKERPAGLRTNMLTALAAAVFTIVTFEIFHAVRAEGSPGASDPIRIIEAVTAGVAFLAAGTIIQSRGKVEGLTTGASMWLSGAIGVACGAGYFVLAAMVTALAAIILVALRWFERLALPSGKQSDKSQDAQD